MNNEEWVTGTIEISVRGEPVEMQLTVPANRVKLRRMLPIFQMMTNSFVGLGVEISEKQGKKVSCQAGCGACCRQPVPLTETETYQIAELVEKMEEPRRSQVKARFDEAVRHFHEIEWFEQMDNYAELTIKERQELVMKYFYEGVPCPFLENESCSIHPDRPLSCREYLVTNPAENCRRPTAETIQMIDPLLKFSQTLRHVSISENMAKLNFVPLVRALEWAEMYPENAPEKSGQEWMAEFFGLLSGKDLPADQSIVGNL
jgi:Fe-S-cluster containining protein